MVFLKNKRYAPLYKKFRVLRVNVKNNNKILKFKKNKWEFFLKVLIKQTITRKFKPYTHYDYSVTKFASQGNSFKKKFKKNLIAKKMFNYFYGDFVRKYLKKHMAKIYHHKLLHKSELICLEFFESRLDSVLYRSKFSFSVKNARQLISHKHVTVNGKIEKNKSHVLKAGDFVSIIPNSFYLIESNLKKIIKKKNLEAWPALSKYLDENYKILKHINYKKLESVFGLLWPAPPTYLHINYKTLEIIFGNIKNFNFSVYFSFKLNLQSIIADYYWH